MAQAIVFGRVTTGLELKTSLKNNPYVMFSLAEHFGFGEAARTQFIQVWAWGASGTSTGKMQCGKGKHDLGIRFSGVIRLHQKRRRHQGQAPEAHTERLGVSSRHRTIQARTCISNRRNGGARSRTAHCRHHRR